MRSNGNRSPLWRVAVLALLALCAGMVSANAQGRRLGLVIGLADYGETKHPTALQDAGLVAQSLRQARFELTEAANLTQTEFRSAFRDFQEKAAAAGPDAVVAIYVSGVGMQDDGENILIPVGARLRQRGDLGLEGLRVSDFLRSLAGVPASARIVMLDASYVHPFSQLVAEGGRGLAPVERREGMLVAYNQSPDQAAQLPRTNYGHYAMALAEALREPGIDLNAVFERVRMRVHDLSQGAETPYHLNGITAPVVLVQPTAEAPVAALPPETVEIQRKPIGELGADDAYARAVRTDTIPVYEEFIRAYPSHVQAKRIRAMIAQRREAYYWQRARRANTDRAYWTYLSRYPRGAHAGEAEARLARLSAPIAPPPQFEEVIYDDLPPLLGRHRQHVVAVEDHLVRRDSGRVRQQPHDSKHGNRLARAGLADNGQHFAGIDVQVDPLHGHELTRARVESNREILDFKQRHDLSSSSVWDRGHRADRRQRD